MVKPDIYDAVEFFQRAAEACGIRAFVIADPDQAEAIEGAAIALLDHALRERQRQNLASGE